MPLNTDTQHICDVYSPEVVYIQVGLAHGMQPKQKFNIKELKQGSQLLLR